MNDPRDPSFDEDAATQVLARCEIEFRELIHQIISPSLFEPVSSLRAERSPIVGTGRGIEEVPSESFWDVRPTQSSDIIASGASRSIAICRAALELHRRSLEPALASSN